MDQVKKQLAVVLQYGFWIGSAIVLFGSLGVWYTTTSTLAKENASKTSQLNTAHTSVTNVKAEMSEQPNALSHAEMERLIGLRQDDVLESWKSLYDRQRNILTWPTEELTEEFVNEFKDLIPIEVHVDHPTEEKDEIESYLRTQYQRYIGNALPAIAEIADAEWSASFSQSASMGMGEFGDMAMMMSGTRQEVSITGKTEGPLVKWSPESQKSVLDDLFPWRGQGLPPSTLEVYYSQENIWILKQLLQIISEVNGDARQPYQAKIREIRAIQIGESVNFDAGEVSKPGEGLIGSGSGMYGMEDMEEMMDMSSMDTMGTMGTTVEAPDPGENRYVDGKKEPIAGSALRSALKSNSAADAEIAVAKRVPVMMSLQIDQRAIQQLLAACGSAPLMVEVSQVRILPKQGMSTLGGASGTMGMMEEMEEEDDMGDSMGYGMEGMGMGMGGNMVVAPPKPAEEFPMDMTVEIYGLIYMYNPPDAEKLGVKDVDKDTVIEGVTEPAPAQAATPEAQPEQTNDVLPTPAPGDPQPDANSPDTTQPPADPDAEPPVADAGAQTPPPAIAIPQP